MTYSADLQLYASHSHFVTATYEHLLSVAGSTLAAETTATTTSSKPLHVAARLQQYRGGVSRFVVDDAHVPWSVAYPEYQPVEYTAPSVLKQPEWADLPTITAYAPRWLGVWWLLF